MITTEKHIIVMEREHQQTVLKAESNMLLRMIEELEAKRDELNVNLDKLGIVRDALESQIEKEQLEFDLVPDSDS